MVSEVLLAAANKTFEPNTVTWIGLGMLGLGSVSTVTGILREWRMKPIIISLVVVVIGAWVALYSN